jgi:hypothetical protein
MLVEIGRLCPRLTKDARELAMGNLHWWEWGLLGVGGYVAFVTLARLMQGRREALLTELTSQAAEEQMRNKKEDKLRRRREREALRLKQLQEAKRKAA